MIPHRGPSYLVFVAVWMLITALLIPVGLILMSDRNESELINAFGGGILTAGIVSAGGLLLFIADNY